MSRPRFLSLTARAGTAPIAALLSALVSPCLASAQSLAGRYVYESPSGPVTLVLQEEGARLVGRMVGADGAVFQLEGVIDSLEATGTIRIGEGAGWFATAFAGEQLELVVAEVDPDTRQPDLNNAWHLAFVRARAATNQTPSDGVTRMNRERMEPSGEHDPALVGAWSYSDTYVSGDFSATSRLSMQILPDGTYLYGKGNVSLGGSYSGNSRGADVTRGKWRTQGGVVYIVEDGGVQWEPYARYYVEGGSMMLTFADGKRQTWYRQ